MQNIVIDKPYVPVPPSRSKLWAPVLKWYLPHMLRRSFGIGQVQCEYIERLRDSLKSGHGILLAPNHSRDEDPLVIGMLTRLTPTLVFIMASWHLFMQGRLKTYFVRQAGGFSIYREGIDRWAVNTAVEMLEHAERPLVMFPEGYISRANERVNELMDGVALIARTAAKRRAKQSPPGKVVVHPVAIRYTFLGDAKAAASTVLDEIETRLSWQGQQHLTLEERIYKVGEALLTLKELEYLRTPQTGTLAERTNRLLSAILEPMENEWTGSNHDGNVNARVKRLRTAILPDMIKGSIDETERKRRWRQLADVYLANQLAHYPPDYIRSNPTPARMLETVERFEEDLTDKVRVHGPMSATVTIGEAIEVNPQREGRGGDDPLLKQIQGQLQTMLTASKG